MRPLCWVLVERTGCVTLTPVQVAWDFRWRALSKTGYKRGLPVSDLHGT